MLHSKISRILLAVSLIVSLSLVQVPVSSAAYVPGFSEAMVSITFDDGFASTYQNALPILSSRNISGSVMVTTGYINTTGYMTWAQVKDLQNTYGWEIGSHTVTHPELPLLTTAEIKNELNNSLIILKNQGLNVTTFATPFGAYTNVVLDEATRIYNIHRGFWDRETLNAYPYDRALITVKSVETGVTPAQVKTWINQAKAENKWLVLVYHEVLPTHDPNYEYTNTIAELTEVADYIKSTGLKVVNPNHSRNRPGINLFNNSSFDNGISDGWSTDSATQVTKDIENNGSYPSPTNAIAVSGSSGTKHLFSNPVVSDPSGEYMLTAFVDTDKVSKGEVGFYVDEYDVAGNWISGKWLGMVTADKITYFSAFFKPSSVNVTKFRIQTYIVKLSSGKVFLDNYELYNVNPSTITPGPTLTPSPSNAPTTTPTPSGSPSLTPTVTSTPTPTISLTVTPTNSPTSTPSPIGTTPSPTRTPTPTSVIPTVTMTQTPTPTQVTSVNLVPNPSFEQLANNFAANWSTDNATNIKVNSLLQGNNGLNSINFTKPAKHSHLFSANIPVTNVTYSWKQYIKAASGSGEFGFYIDEFNDTGNWISGQWKGAIWSPFTGIHTISYTPSSLQVKSIRLQYYIVTNSNFNLYLDSVSLTN